MKTPLTSDPSQQRVSPPLTHEARCHLMELRNRLRCLLERYVVAGSRVADYGCGTAPYRGLLQDKASVYLSIDLASNPDSDVAIDHLGRVPLDDGCADVVLSTQVLEHVPSPASYLSECWRLLTPGGLLIVSTHGFWSYHPSPCDYWRWTQAGLEKVLDDNGFEVLEVQHVLSLASSAVQLFHDAFRSRLPGPAGKVWAFLCQGLISLLEGASERWTKGTRLKDAGTYVVAARKRTTRSLATPAVVCREGSVS